MTLKAPLFNYRVRLNPHRLKNDNRLYADIRAVGKKGTDYAGKTLDVAIRLKTGDRVKMESAHWNGKQVIGGFENVTEVNTRIITLFEQVVSFLERNPSSTPQLIERHLYGDKYEQWKGKQNIARDLLVMNVIASDKHQQLRKTNGKKKIITTKQVTTVENDYEVTRTVEQVKEVDPLAITENFPNDFSPEVYEYYKALVLADDHYLYQLSKFKVKDQLLNHFIKGKIKRDLYKENGTVVTIDPNTVKAFNKLKKADKLEYTFTGLEDVEIPEPLKEEMKKEQDVTHLIKLDAELKNKQTAFVKSLLPLEERYLAGEYDKADLFEVFISGFYQPYPNKINKTSIIWRLLEYKVKANPAGRVTDFNADWCKAFLTYIFTNGVTATNFRNVDPSTVDAKTFVGNTIKYDKDIYKNVIKWFKDAVNKLTLEKKLPRIDLTEIKVKDFLTKEDLKRLDDTPQDEKYLTKTEFDKLFKFKFKDDELEVTRDRFVLMVMFGGLRVNEFRADRVKTGGALSVEDDGHGNKYVSYYTSHQSKLREMANPINAYSDAILKKYDYEIPFYGDSKGKPVEVDNTDFNEKLKAMAKATGFLTRRVKDKQRNPKTGEKELVKVAIQDDITSLYARHSLYPIFHYKEMPIEEIQYFAGHTGNRGTSKHYNDKYFKDHTRKRKMIERYGIKPE